MADRNTVVRRTAMGTSGTIQFITGFKDMLLLKYETGIGLQW
jgi:hypothetical protein